MTFYRVRGTLLAAYFWPRDSGYDEIALDLIVPGRSAYEAECRVLLIVAEDYDHRRWATRPTIEQLPEEESQL